MHLFEILITSTILGAAFAIPVQDASAQNGAVSKPKSTTSATSSTTSNSMSSSSSPAAGGYLVNQRKPKKKTPAPVQYAAAYAKYHKTPPKAVENAAAADRDNSQFANNVAVASSTTSASGVVVATPEPYDQEYLCTINVGGQSLDIDFDTGSSDLWVFSSELSASDQSGHGIYNPSKSTTSKKLTGLTWSISYGDGSSASGDVYSDNVRVGGLTVTTQAVEAAQTVSSDFQQDTQNDGVFGLAFLAGNTVSPTQQKGFFDTAIAQGKLAKNLFTANLKKGAPGSYNFGAIDPTQYTGSITYANVDSSGALWQFTASGYGIGTTFTATSLTGIADTGTSLLLLPSTIVSAYYAKVTGAAYDNNYGAYTFPCSSTLPNFLIGVSTARYTLPGTYLNFAPLGDGSGKCYGGLQSSDGMGINVFGDIFLKAVFVVFDKTQSTPRIGFASKPT